MGRKIKHQKIITIKEADQPLFEKVEKLCKLKGESFASFTAKAIRMKMEKGDEYDKGIKEGLRMAKDALEKLEKENE